MKKISDFPILSGEANFGPPISFEAEGGAHIAAEIIPKFEAQFFAIDWPDGLPRHDSNRTIRFPHGHMIFGETIAQCAERLTMEQLGMSIKSAKILDLDSYIDNDNHWHIEPICLCELTALPETDLAVSTVIPFTVDNIPEMSFWKSQELRSYLMHLSR